MKYCLINRRLCRFAFRLLCAVTCIKFCNYTSAVLPVRLVPSSPWHLDAYLRVQKTLRLLFQDRKKALNRPLARCGQHLMQTLNILPAVVVAKNTGNPSRNIPKHQCKMYYKPLPSNSRDTRNLIQTKKHRRSE